MQPRSRKSAAVGEADEDSTVFQRVATPKSIRTVTLSPWPVTNMPSALYFRALGLMFQSAARSRRLTVAPTRFVLRLPRFFGW